jgi:hypothetical protein
MPHSASVRLRVLGLEGGWTKKSKRWSPELPVSLVWHIVRIIEADLHRTHKQKKSNSGGRSLGIASRPETSTDMKCLKDAYYEFRNGGLALAQ